MGYPAILNRGSILLAREPRITDSRNDTTATAQSKDGCTMAVSFWIAKPPELSLFSIYCTKNSKRCYFSVLPRVVGADGPFVLLCGTLDNSLSREYFLYKGGPSPELEWIPSPSPEDDLRGAGVRELGILGHGDGGQYLLAALRDAPDDGYQLRIYSSRTKSWSTRMLRNPCPGIDRVIPDKVMTLGGQEEGLLGWVDLSHGLLVCNMLLLQDQDDQDPPAGAVSFIPLPDPLPGNRYKLKYPIPPTQKMEKHPMADEPYSSANWFRDLTCVNGVLKFIEMENPTPENKDNIIYNSDLITSLKRKAIDGNSKQQLSSFRDAWRAVTWTQNLVSSSNFWCQTCTAHVADIKGQHLAFKDFYSAFPILSPDDGEDILYLKSLPEPSDRDGSVVAVDIGNKSLIAVARYYLPDFYYYNHGAEPEHPFHACTLSRYLDTTNPGIQVSACRMITEASSSARETKIPSKPRATIQSLLELAGSLQRAQNPRGIIIKNSHISQVHPVENNLPQQHKWIAPPGLPLWPHQNNLPPQQCFNKPDGPWYAPLAPRDNYQPLCPPSKRQLMSSSEFGPHEAPKPCFNSYYGASAPNSLAYGTHTTYPELPPPIPERPIIASWPHPRSVRQHPPFVVHRPTPL